MSRLSLRGRLTLWYTFALVVVLCLFGADVLWVLNGIGMRRVDRELESLLATLEDVVKDELVEMGRPAPAAEEARHMLTARGRAIAIFDAAGGLLSANWNGLDFRGWSSSVPTGLVIWSESTPGGVWRMHARPHVFGTTTMILLTASPMADVVRERHEVQEAILVGLPIVLLLAAGGGFWLASIGLRPISEMARQASLISLTGVEDLGSSDRRDELGQFARAFNGLVGRLRSALRTHRQFMADASHELRTPVAIVRTAVDVALSRDHRGEGEYREALAIAGDEARRLGRLVDGMLVLARADAGGYPFRAVDLHLDEVVAECCRAVEVLAADRGVRMRTTPAPDTPIRGDEDLLRQLVLNVLQNAVQHTRSGGCVSVEIRRQTDAQAVQIRVTDTGPGIPSADHARIFDRFVQLDSARHGSGAGLGLPIARWIAEVHHGTLILESSGPGGSTFCATLPSAPVSPPACHAGGRGFEPR